jgi:hypothetical protein
VYGEVGEGVLWKGNSVPVSVIIGVLDVVAVVSKMSVCVMVGSGDFVPVGVYVRFCKSLS